MLILSTTGIPLLLLQSKYCSIHWHQVPGISPLSYLWAAVSHFNYFLLDGSISSILFPLLYPWWQYQQYPCLFTISWMALSAVSYSIIIHLYLSFSLHSFIFYLEKTPLFRRKKTFSILTFPYFMRFICVHLLLGKNQKLLFFRRKLKPNILCS